MNAIGKRSSLLCPNCNKLISRSIPECPHCGLKNPGSFWKNTLLTNSGDGTGLLRIILVANVVMFVVSLLIDPRFLSFSKSPFNFLSPSNNSLLLLGSTGTIPIFHFHRWWTLITANYLHGSLLHIIFNMIALHQLGPLIIREYGVSRMIAIYTLAGVGGFAISALFGVRFTIGASAAVCGLIGAALYYGKSRGGVYGNMVYSQIGGWAIGIFLFGFLVPGINNWGHGGGMAVGALVGVLLGYQERRRELFGHKLLAGICIACTALALIWSLFTTTIVLFG